MKKFLLLLSLIFSFSSYGQDLNKYSYVVIPEQFSFLKQADQYQLNSLTKFLFEKYGFEAFIEGEEAYVKLSPDRCEGLYADVLNDSGLFRTKLNLTLKDCRNQQVFISREGVSREKDYGIAYQEALREAFKSIEELNYINNEVIVTGTPNLQVQIKEQEIVKSTPEVKREQKMVQPSVEIREAGNITPTSSEVKREKKILPNSSETKNETPVENQVSPTSLKSEVLNFERDGRYYFLKYTNNGYNIFQEGMTEPFATLISSAAGKNFVYSSMTSKGMAHMDNEGNLVIEILKDNNSLETIIYKVRGQ